MKDIFHLHNFAFPYTDIRFPGMSREERILFVTRESDTMQKMQLVGLSIICIFVFALGMLLLSLLQQIIPQLGWGRWILAVLTGSIFLIGLWWITETHRKSLFIITTRRLTKIIYTTPFTWYQFSLGLDEIEDTGSYSSSYFEALFGLGYFVARSGAAAIKNFKIVNITFAQDLHNYVNKLLYVFKHHPNKINQFRPFIPYMKGEARERLFEKYSEYKTEFE